MILVLVKSRSCKSPNLGCAGAKSPGWFDVSPKSSAYDVMHEWVHWWSCQSPVAHSCSLLNHLNSLHRGMLKFNAVFDAYSLFYSQLFWMWWPHATHAHSVASTAPLTSTVKSSLFTHVHSSPLCLAARLHDAVQTVLIILTMVGLFPDRPQMFTEGGVGARKNSNRWNY